MKNMFATLFAATCLLTLVTGCPSEGTVEDTSIVNDNVGGVMPDPSAIDAASGSAFESDANSGKWVDPRALENGADADGWRQADPKNNLGFPVIYFAYDSDMLVPSETANLDKIAAYLGNNVQLGLVIEGHCDNRGTDEYNRALGERRANAIRSYLAGKGVADNRMKTKSLGEDQPAASGSGESIWKLNRRGVLIPMIMPR